MSIIIEKTYQFLDELDKTDLITNIKKYKAKLLLNSEVLKLIAEYNQTLDNEKKISIKKQLYEIPDYSNYMKLYNELAMIIFQINKKYSAFTNTKQCNHQQLN